ncbi:unnamed protein product [Protopolystoma xenopodis]|uniref:long-chain-fatty-acid--CoA ligase n=1 Tax=Protopolystoma xenopodis TaxID=117903 RepID=A0A3S5CKL7_9PLAT|nr:unnamed protein product [Protopolystoma xenopodis]
MHMIVQNKYHHTIFFLISYGLTETCSSGAIMECGDLRCNHVGAPLSSVEIKLRAWHEGGYSPHDSLGPRGEILISGGPVSRGYFHHPELTCRDFVTDPDGRRWFCTGESFGTHTTLQIGICNKLN